MKEKRGIGFMDEKDSMDFLDETDRQILLMLKSNSRTALKTIGESVHLTAQAVSNRIIRLQKLQVIRRYTIDVNEEKLGMAMIAYITVFMKTREHQQLQRLLQAEDIVKEVHRISGDAYLKNPGPLVQA
ncbi:MAG: Lrp/AsnC family transcriptional regulator [Selenomonadaceae bacterium]